MILIWTLLGIAGLLALWILKALVAHAIVAVGLGAWMRRRRERRKK